MSMARTALVHQSRHKDWFFGGGPMIEETIYHWVRML